MKQQDVVRGMKVIAHNKSCGNAKWERMVEKLGSVYGVIENPNSGNGDIHVNISPRRYAGQNTFLFKAEDLEPMDENDIWFYIQKKKV